MLDAKRKTKKRKRKRKHINIVGLRCQRIELGTIRVAGNVEGSS